MKHTPHWKFELAEGLNIPEQDGQADMICFFSVFTHLLHEESYIYLKDALRVLKPEGKIIFTFLDFRNKNNWQHFERSVGDIDNPNAPHDQFMSCDLIECWAEHLDIKIEAIHDGHEQFIELDKPMSRPKEWEKQGMETVWAMGQSICVLSKKL